MAATRPSRTSLALGLTRTQSSREGQWTPGTNGEEMTVYMVATLRVVSLKSEAIGSVLGVLEAKVDLSFASRHQAKSSPTKADIARPPIL